MMYVEPTNKNSNLNSIYATLHLNFKNTTTWTTLYIIHNSQIHIRGRYCKSKKNVNIMCLE